MKKTDLAIVVILIFIVGCSKREKLTQIVPGKSIGGVELGMSKEQVLSVLGEPSSQLDKETMDKLGVYDVTSDGKYEKVPSVEMEKIKLLIYQKPPLSVLIDENSKVVRLSISYCEDISVKGYPFLKFVYLTENELKAVGEPSSTTRMTDSETKIISMVPKGTILEFYEYHYDPIGINLGLVFDRTKRKSSKHFIGINHIDIYTPEK